MKNIKKQKGAALLIILTIVVAAITFIVTSNLSVNTLRNTANTKSTLALQEARKALLGYALTSTPPGQLPCPDSNNDGLEDLSSGNCTVQLGQLPYRTLMLPKLHDGYNSNLWYTFNQNLRAVSSYKKNSSIPSALNLDGIQQEAIIIAPNRPFNNQSRDNNSTLTDFLEGGNSDADLNNYSRVVDDQHNDILLSISSQKYWSLIEQSLLRRIANDLKQYNDACGSYPWASVFGSSPYISQDNLQQGNVPFDSALPTDWNTGCATGINLPSWLGTHWGNEVYYAMCTSAQASCLSINGSTVTNSEAVLVAPGTQINAQFRPSALLSDYFENANAINDYNFHIQLSKNLNGSFNDVVHLLSP